MSTVEANQPKLVSLPCDWPYRLLLNLIILAFIGFLAFITMVIKTDFVQEKLSHLEQDFYDYTSTLGFTIDDITVEGRERTKLQEIVDILNLQRSDNILSLDIQEIKQKTETLPWVKSAVVRRSYFPNVLHISLQERHVQTLWQMSNNFYPIDDEGNVINVDYKADRPMLLIVGKGAPENIPQLMEIIQEDNDIYKRIKVANFISNRRWNLILDDVQNGITIKLPEEKIKRAWKKLIELNTSKGLLKRKLTIIDLRLEDKVIVKLEKTNKDDKIKLQEVKESNI